MKRMQAFITIALIHLLAVAIALEIRVALSVREWVLALYWYVPGD
jgi:hypothetical protein